MNDFLKVKVMVDFLDTGKQFFPICLFINFLDEQCV